MECKRCGTCCRKGGPALHKQDMSVLGKGLIQPHHLYTIRKGEPAYDPAADSIIFLPSEIIKVKGEPCIFFSDRDKRCTIYNYRPIECRALKCWDTKAIERLFLKNLLSRGDLFQGAGSIMKLIAAYEESFSLELILNASSTHLSLLIEKDLQFRETVIKNYGISPEVLPLVLGRAIREVVATLGQNR